MLTGVYFSVAESAKIPKNRVFVSLPLLYINSIKKTDFVTVSRSIFSSLVMGLLGARVNINVINVCVRITYSLQYSHVAAAAAALFLVLGI